MIAIREALPYIIYSECPDVGLPNRSALPGRAYPSGVGYAAGPEEIIQEMNTLQQYTFVCAPSIAQHAALTALKLDHQDKVDAYRVKRDLAYTLLNEKFSVVRPDGAFYIFPAAPGGDGEAFVRRAIEKNIITIPGNVFSERNSHIRISFAAPDDTIREGIEILNGLADY